MNNALPKSNHKNLALPNADISSSQQQIRKLLTRKHCTCVLWVYIIILGFPDLF